MRLPGKEESRNESEYIKEEYLICQRPDICYEIWIVFLSSISTYTSFSDYSVSLFWECSD